VDWVVAVAVATVAHFYHLQARLILAAAVVAARAQTAAVTVAMAGQALRFSAS
jgi:hypothetical protein